MELIIINHKGTQTLITNRLKLRKYILSDAKEIFYNYASDERVTKFLSWQPYNNIEDVSCFLTQQINEYSKNTFYHWVIEIENKPIGSISIINLDEKNNSCEIGYCIGYNYWNKGITSEALYAVMNFLFNEVDIYRIVAKHDVENIASGEVMQKCNMTLEGKLREHYLRHDGTRSDSLIYSILKKEFNLIK